MPHKTAPLFVPALLVLFGSAALFHPGQGQKPGGEGFSPAIPKTWDDEALATLDVPLANAAASPVHVASDYYYRLAVRPIYKSYPVYHPSHEPPGYMEWVKQREPEIAFDASSLKTERDWIRAGELVFDAPVTFSAVANVSDVRDPAWYETRGVPVAKDGTLPLRYVIRKKGEVELGTLSCGMCHTRIMPDGTLTKGAQGAFPFGRAVAFNLRANTAKAEDKDKFLEQIRRNRRRAYAAPWVELDPDARFDHMSLAEIALAHEAIPPGVQARSHTSVFFPPQIPDLIGVKDRRYLDHTGDVRHRTIGDLMRYAAVEQGGERFDRYGDFIVPILPDPGTRSRYSDEQLYALALYLYSLTPPPNPNQWNARASTGQKIFEREGCGGCHTPPLYTNNKLTPAEGFASPADHFKKYDILPVSVGTDPSLALKTRKGTGYYKVPSLKGVWYRGPFEHNGSVATLEDWFDPRRLRDDYVPTGFVGYGVKRRAVKGHEFGLKLTEDERKALIAFLKTR